MSIRVRDLTFGYRDFSLHVPDLDFAGAQLTAIVGPNGAGKTTFLKCLSGILPAAKGSVFIEDRDIALMSERDVAKRLAYVPQEHASAFNYTVGEFVLMGRAAHIPLFAVPAEADLRFAREALDYVGLGHYAERPVYQLSSGERRLVLIARALAQMSDILILDEPTTFLDPRHEVGLLELAKKLARERKKTILLTLHNLNTAVRYADALVVMKRGGIVASGRPDDIVTESLLENVYDIKMEIVRQSGRTFIVA
jgi:iron complex transport system ATP-binding protein